MTYQPYPIAQFATGLDKELQPWLTPDDSQFELFDGYIYKGVWQKREGYSQYATGERASAPYTESRMVHTVTVSANEVPDGIITSFTFNVAGTTKPLRRGGFRAIDRTALGVQSQIIQDDGLGGTLVGSNGTITTVLNYTTTLATPQGVTFTIAPPVGHLITLALDVHQGLPVMGIMNFYTQQNTKDLIVADTTYVNKYNSSTNRLDDISPSTLLTGDKTSFMSWTNYASANDLQRLLFVNFKDPVQQYNGTTITPYPIFTDSAQVTAAAFGTGNGTVGPYTFNTPANTGIVPGSVTITATAQVVTDNQFGGLKGDGTGTVNYLTGAISVTFNAAVAGASAITITYKQLKTPIDTALHIFQFKDRLVVLYTKETGVQFGKRIRVSGTGAFCDVFTADAIGAGVIDIPDDSFISSADFNRDDLIIITRNEVWVLKYQNNDIVPFALDRIDQSRGSDAPHGTITYLNRTNALSSLGLIMTDGYSVVRSDDKIPDYSYNEIDQDNFNLCFAGSVDKDRDHYLIHPSDGAIKSDRILVTNYEEDNYAVYRIPLSCMGNYIVSFDVTWNDLLVYSTWDELASVYGDWSSFAYSKGGPVSLGGGHEGQIVLLNQIETEDYPVKIRDMAVIDSATLQVVTDFQKFQVGDMIEIEAVNGMFEVNNKQAQIIEVVSDYEFNLQINTSGFALYDDGGVASKCIKFQSKTKKFNPFTNIDKKVCCGWIYFYMSTTGTDLTRNSYINAASQTDPCELDIPGHGFKTGDQVYINSVLGMTELNGNYYYITVLDLNTIELNGIDATGFTPYTSGGFASVPEDAILQLRCITNDREQSTQINTFNPAPYQINLTSQEAQNGIKKWYKTWINQTARFVQFEVINNQAGSKVQIQAIMPGFAPVGRMI